MLWILIVALAIFAILKELEDQPNSYRKGIFQKGDDYDTLFSKTSICLHTELTTIKWRRCFLSAVLVVVMLFSLVFVKFPSQAELVLSLLIVYVVYYGMWHNYMNSVSAIAVKNGEKNLSSLKRIFKTEKKA